MSDQDDPTERKLDQAVEALLGLPEGSDSNLLGPIEREKHRKYVADQMNAFARDARPEIAARIRHAQKTLEDRIADLPAGHPHREKPEARIAELKAQLAALDKLPIDYSRMKIDVAVSRPPRRDLSIVEEPAETDQQSADLGSTGQYKGRSTEGNVAQVREVQKKSLKAKKLVRRNQKYEAIDEALKTIAKSWPTTQEEVFQSLQGRNVLIPQAKPFETARGWVAGFTRDQAAARAWLSKRWAELNLPPLPRGPKNSKK